eukprot:CAMPEP_0206539712 /NCGR_PEP_ID=MMETSP0325_2-20121206/8582_1 /ASSEMBLY_ACC=CAM_ASM_000347 /TAXON_ID=2866 /ORGANISM="Crypthecodinium cohnii, Strain Seligo" /LENGTH=313 /DNA_ID=CAMNT_0054037315 /DNA_START=630 /DNA_END=1568 /DNA_ORIENTATION=-
MEGVLGLGMISGPIVGSLLFGVGGGEEHIGFVLPFMVLGGIEALFAVFNLFLLPNLPLPPPKKPSLRKYSWKVVVPWLNCVVSGAGIGLLSPTMEPHLLPIMSVQTIGFVFAACCGCYTLAAPLVGCFDDATSGRFALFCMALGNVITGVGYGLTAPVPLHWGGKEWSLGPAFVWPAACLIGAGLAFGLVPIYKQILQYAKHEDQEQRDVASSALLTVSMSTGAFLGPVLGGMLSEALGTRKTYIVAAVAFEVMAVVLLCFGLAPGFREPVAPLAAAPVNGAPVNGAAGDDLEGSTRSARTVPLLPQQQQQQQ